MSSFEDITDDEPPVIDPYEVLGIERAATESEIKSAYRSQALKHHPDKVPDDQKDQAHTKFQSIAFAYAVLSDPNRRRRFDATGSTAETLSADDDFSWVDFYREQYRDAVSSDAIDKFAAVYKKSDGEKDDVLIAYERGKGNMDRVYASVMLSNVLEDDERFRAIIDEAIAAGHVPRFANYTGETKSSKERRVKAAEAEAAEADEYARELGVHEKLFGDKNGTKGKKSGGKGKKGEGSEDALAALIQHRQESRGASFLDNLAEKYGAKPKTKKGKKRVAGEEEDENDEPSEEAFQAAAARLGKAKIPGGNSKPEKSSSRKKARK